MGLVCDPGNFYVPEASTTQSWTEHLDTDFVFLKQTQRLSSKLQNFMEDEGRGSWFLLLTETSQQ